MNNITLANNTHIDNLMAMTNSQLEAWFGAGGLSVEVVASCFDPECTDCVTVDRTQQAA